MHAVQIRGSSSNIHFGAPKAVCVWGGGGQQLFPTLLKANAGMAKLALARRRPHVPTNIQFILACVCVCVCHFKWLIPNEPK